MSDIGRLLPPILIGAGILLPALIQNSPFKIPRALRAFAGIVACIICWAAYYTVIGLGDKWLFASWMTIGPISFAAVLLVSILGYAWRKPQALSSSSVYFVYIISIFLLALATGNWVGQSNITIITFRTTEPLHSVIVRFAEPDAEVNLFTDTRGNRHNWSWVIPNDEKRFQSIQKVYLNGDNEFDGSKIIPIHSGFPAKRYEMSVETTLPHE